MIKSCSKKVCATWVSRRVRKRTYGMTCVPLVQVPSRRLAVLSFNVRSDVGTARRAIPTGMALLAVPSLAAGRGVPDRIEGNTAVERPAFLYADQAFRDEMRERPGIGRLNRNTLPTFGSEVT